MKVDKIKFGKSPVENEYRRQKSKVASSWCLHRYLKKSVFSLIDDKQDEIIEVEELVCIKCGYTLKEEEVRERKLEEFKKISKTFIK